MKSRHSLICMAVLFVFPLRETFAQDASITIDVLATFDYPGVGNSTLPQKINDAGEIAGYYFDSAGVARAFVRLRNGNFSPPIVEPNDTGNSTQARGINNLRTLCGEYVNGSVHGFFLSGNTFTEFDVPDATNTHPRAINNAGDFCGFTDTSTGSPAFVSVAGSITTFSVDSSGFNEALGINNLGQIVGDYTDSVGIFHGFLRDADGTLTFPIDPPDSTETTLFGNNDRRWMVGRYVDSAGATHALFFQSPTRFIVYDYPGMTFTSFNGINRQGLICGRYEDSSSIGHGILARVRRTPTD
jgi:hypothetical protein